MDGLSCVFRRNLPEMPALLMKAQLQSLVPASGGLIAGKAGNYGRSIRFYPALLHATLRFLSRAQTIRPVGL